MENATKNLAAYINHCKYSDLSEKTINKAKESILDYICAILAGHYNSSLLSRNIAELIIHNGGKEEATIIGTSVKVPLINAALVNGVISHVVELDDGHRIARGHPGVAVISSALPIAEYAGSSGLDLITAVVVGYDIFIRVASAINPSHLNRGYHTTGTCGTLAAAAAASKLLDLSELQTANALGLAGIQAAGLLEVTVDGQMSKALHTGKAAYGGVLAALMAGKSVQGPKTVIEGKKGFARTMSNECDYDIMFNDLNKRFFIDDCYIKLYPSCRHTHAPIDAVFELLLEYKFDISDIDDILVKTYPTAISFAGEIFRPESAEAAKFSIPYCICAALTKRNFGLNELSSECLNDPAILALTDKVRIEADASLESSVPNVKGAEVYISLNDGRKLYKRIDLPKGEIENPVTRNELIRKLESCTSYCFNDKKRQEIINLVFNLEKKDNINGLVALLGSNS